jgi:hypothetical protein
LVVVVEEVLVVVLVNYLNCDRTEHCTNIATFLKAHKIEDQYQAQVSELRSSLAEADKRAALAEANKRV